MTNLLWHSAAPWAPTGYGQQTATFTPRLRDAGHDVTLSAYWGLLGAAMEWQGMLVYPGDEHWGNVLLPNYAKRHAPCQVITLMDVWVLQAAVMRSLDRLACWTPVDHQPLPPRVGQFFQESGARPIAMSRFGESMLTAAGFDPLYVPHGVDTNVFRPHADRHDLRASIGMPADAFIVGVVANNQGNAPPRKAFPQLIMAFSEFRRNHSDAMLYLHSELTGIRQGINLLHLCETFDIPTSAVGYAPQFELEIGGIPAEQMAALYSSMDVLLNPSYGEGFGIPIVEAQACGTPVIVSDWTAMPELCGAGWKVQGESWYDAQHASFFLTPSVGEIVEALEAAYAEAEGLRDQARSFALDYDADRVTERFWAPALDELAATSSTILMPGLNRAQRRRTQREKATA